MPQYIGPTHRVGSVQMPGARRVVQTSASETVMDRPIDVRMSEALLRRMIFEERLTDELIGVRFGYCTSEVSDYRRSLGILRRGEKNQPPRKKRRKYNLNLAARKKKRKG